MVRTITAAHLIGLFFVLQIFAATPRTLFQQAGTAYKAGDFDKAVQLYASIDPKGPAVWFNTGNCHYALKQYQDAIVAWKRARQGASWQMMHAINDNIEAGYAALGLSHEKSGIVSLFDWAAQRISPLLMQLLFLLCWYLLFFLIIVKRSLPLVWVYTAVLIFFLMLFGYILVMQYTQYRYKKAVVVKKTALLVGPHEQYDVVKQVSMMHDVLIQDTQAGWYKVATQDATGWVSADALELM